MQLLISTGYDETRMEASPEVIHSALYPDGNIDYGSSFTLESLDNWTLDAICVSSVYLPPNEEGEFHLILDNGTSHNECLTLFTRSQTVEYLNKFLAGDMSWVDNFDWDEV
jgi:hypothetical protein